MAAKSHVVIFALVLSILATAAFGAIIPRIWETIKNPNDPAVVEIAKFAVAEHNKKAKAALRFVTVVKGESSVTIGAYYKLVISAKDGSATKPKNYMAFVHQRPLQKLLQLIFFKETA